MRTRSVALVLALLAFADRGETRLAAGSGSSSLVFHTIPSGGVARTYGVALPDAYDGTARPVVFCFHGGGGSASGAADRYGIVEEANARGWIAVFPEGRELPAAGGLLTLQTWNGGDCCGPAAASDVDDVGFFDDMLAQLTRDYSIDRARVFSTGFSNGAVMTYRLGVERPGALAGIAPVGGALEFRAPGVPIPYLGVHGALDEEVPPGGGVGSGVSNYAFNSQVHSIRPFLRANGIPGPGLPSVIGEARLFTPTTPPGGTDTWYLLALDGGHTWPGSSGSPIDPTIPVHQDVPATPLIFDFFEAQFP